MSNESMILSALPPECPLAQRECDGLSNEWEAWSVPNARGEVVGLVVGNVNVELEAKEQRKLLAQVRETCIKPVCQECPFYGKTCEPVAKNNSFLAANVAVVNRKGVEEFVDKLMEELPEDIFRI